SEGRRTCWRRYPPERIRRSCKAKCGKAKPWLRPIDAGALNPACDPRHPVGIMFQAIREQIDTIFREDPAAKSVVEIVLCYPGFHATLFHRLAHKLYIAGLPLIPRMISQLSRFLTGVEIH